MIIIIINNTSAKATCRLICIPNCCRLFATTLIGEIQLSEEDLLADLRADSACRVSGEYNQAKSAQVLLYKMSVC